MRKNCKEKVSKECEKFSLCFKFGKHKQKMIVEGFWYKK